MRERPITLGEAEKYLMERYGLKWSRPTWRKLIREKKLDGGQFNEGGWWYTSQESIDRLIESL